MKTITKLWIGLGILAIASPIGLFLPEKFNAGSAWGEWGADEIKGLIGYVPRGLEKLSFFWKAALPDYAFKGWEEKGSAHLGIAYCVSALIGIGLCLAGAYFIGKLLSKKGR